MATQITDEQRKACNSLDVKKLYRDSLNSDFDQLEAIHNSLRFILCDVLTKEEVDTEVADKAYDQLAKASGHELNGEKAELDEMYIAMGKANEIISALRTSWLITIDEKIFDHTITANLIKETKDASIGPGPTPEELMPNLPWMLKFALENILSTGIYKKDPASVYCVAARTLACILEIMEKGEGFNWEPKEELEEGVLS